MKRTHTSIFLLFPTLLLAGCGTTANLAAPGHSVAKPYNQVSTVTASVLHVGEINQNNHFWVYFLVKNSSKQPIIFTNNTVELTWTNHGQTYNQGTVQTGYMQNNTIGGTTPFQIEAGQSQTVIGDFPQLTNIPNPGSVKLVLLLSGNTYQATAIQLNSNEAINLAALQKAQAKAAAQQQAQANAAAAAQQQQQLQSNISSAASAVEGDIQQLSASLPALQQDLQQTTADLQTEQKDLGTTYQEEQTTLALAAQHPNGDDGQVGSDAGQVGSDAGQVGADQGQIGSDQGQLNSDLASVQNDVSQLQSDDQNLLSLEQQLPNYQPSGGLPSQSAVKSAINQANNAMASANKQMNKDLAAAQTMVNEANHDATVAGQAQ
ncbi:hypothetical protein [Sulfobacillus sp. hq2]|uniref:hypothetical protein n=1 Tax=Sulfobacillus TaxID=28033 RepID=UPI000CD05086|nr:hypothetical protein [Sulfobacillus sp. hq2]POB10682.1 hypothetical protein CO251_07590 [Sulfobacillus sp. hq2]